MEAVAQFLAQKFYYVFLAVLGVYVIVKIKNKHSVNKRKSYFIVAIGVFLIYTGAVFPIQGILPYGFIPVLLVIVTGGVAYFLRRKWPFRLKCAGCGQRLDSMTILSDDRNLCLSCLSAAEEKNEITKPEAENSSDTL